MRNTLVIFTHGSPFVNGENAFLLPEIQPLAARFQRVILVPTFIPAHPVMPMLPSNVEVYKKATEANTKAKVRLGQLKALVGFSWLKDLHDFKSFSDIKNELFYIAAVRSFQKRFWRMKVDLGLKLNETLFYTFWMTCESSGLAEIAAIRRDMRFVTRAHGYDLYDYRVCFRSRYFRELTLKTASGVFCCSREGCNYLNTRYSGYEDHVKVGYLGVECKTKGPAFPALNDKTKLRVITVANLVPGKQIPRFIKGLISFAIKYGQLEITYDVIGGGPERGSIENVSSNSPRNLKVNLFGEISNEKVLSNYVKSEYDLFALPSASEGLSVAVMEAMSFGIPALVTNVGGMGELVKDGVSGLMMKGDFDSSEVVFALDRFLSCDRIAMKQAAFEHVRNNFSREKVRDDFAEVLSTIS